ncbi:MAG: metallophosphoesterase [Anaerolineales bacterium]|nr:MAG: metallophosphoesterase [Anaerolineales bacterium]
MKILAVSDQVVPSLYNRRICDRFGDIELIISCGDLPYSYLEFIHTMLNAPCFYVHGNHDWPEYTEGGRRLAEPGGWVDLPGRTKYEKGMLLAGLEGSIRYKPGAPFQYSDAEMSIHMMCLTPRLLLNRMRRGRWLDILVTHSPPLGIHDGEDNAHRGFKALLKFAERFRPAYLLHGHKHTYRPTVQCTRYRDTEIINVYPYRVIEC